MKYLKGNEIRQMWLDFFKEKGHSIEQGASLVPNDDPTLLWMNAGVAALKKYFDGTTVPKNPRIVNAQKCIRTNDIENVGKTARHHTFFEMLGNFSIGDYFREEAITWGFELLTSPKWFGFDKEKLYMTIYPSDFETRDLWISLGMDPSHIIPTEENNFWEIGEGPCGPCTEIFFDRGPKYGDFTKQAIEDDIPNDRYIEIWNIVFSQYNAKQGLKRSEYPELPNKNIDTGSGLERLASVIQEVDTNFETDFFMPIIQKLEVISGVKYTGQMAFKVIADHIRTVSFAISDGAMLSNEGRGYVLRRLLRRAVKYGKKLGIEGPFMDQLVDEVIMIMKDFYPNLVEQEEIIKKVISAEESKFLETLSSGEKRFEQCALSTENNTISGEDAFLLYDTFGFPIELTVEYAEEKGLKVDIDSFEAEMEKQKNRARNARKDMQSMKSQNEEYLHFTEESQFVGYDEFFVQTKIIKVFEEGIVLEKTPFYATSGGQVADHGIIYNDQFVLDVYDVSKLPNGQFLHHVTIKEGTPKEGVIVHAKVDEQKRRYTTYNHSATHLLFKVLREELGSHVSQQGSQVTSESLRFDFNHFEPLSEETILKVESKVQEMIQHHYKQKTDIVTVEEARSKGAIAEFGEKYDDLVRCVDLGYTLDLCGGTHVEDIYDIRSFAIKSVSSIGSGIYRVEALTNDHVSILLNSLTGLNQDIENIQNKAKTLLEEARQDGFELDFHEPNEVIPAGSYIDVIHLRNHLSEYQKAVKDLEKEFQKAKEQKALTQMDVYFNQIVEDKLILEVPSMEVSVLKQLADNIMAKITKGFVLLGSIYDNKVVFVCKSNHPAYHAGQLVKQASMICGGNGGGRPDFAQAGGKDIDKIQDAINEIKKVTA